MHAKWRLARDASQHQTFRTGRVNPPVGQRRLYLPHRHENMNRTASKHRDSFARMPAGVVVLPQGLSTPAQTDRQNTECRSTRGGAGVLDRVGYGSSRAKKNGEKSQVGVGTASTGDAREAREVVFGVSHAQCAWSEATLLLSHCYAGTRAGHQLPRMLPFSCQSGHKAITMSCRRTHLAATAHVKVGGDAP